MTQTTLSAIDELKQYKQWIPYDAKKAPLNIKTGGHAKWANPTTHCSYSDVKQAVTTQPDVFKGYGFILTSADPFVVLDFDHCIHNGKIDADVREIILKLNSYAEVSPNGKGVHLWVRGTLQHALVANPLIDGVEAYGCSNHFITVTENHVGNTPFTIEDRQSELDELILAIEAKRKQCQKASNVLQKLIRDLGAMATGGRNTELAKVAWLAGKFIAEYGLRERTIEDAISDACEKNGLSLDEPEQTKRSHASQLAAGKAAAGTNAAPPAPPKPKIYLGEQLDVELDAILTELYNANVPPELFVRGGTLARVHRDEKQRPEIETVSDLMLLNRVARVADFFKYNATKEEWVNAHPPAKHAKLITVQDEWLFPSLTAVAEVPILRADYSIVDALGYDELSHVTYIPQPGLRIPTIAKHPTQADAIVVAERVFGYLAEFPYVDDADRANAYGLLLTTVTRGLYSLTPLALLTAPKPGTGKTLIYKVLMLLLTGRVGATTTMPTTETEMTKTLTSLLLGGAIRAFVFDNTDSVIDSGKLAAFLTSEYSKERVLTTQFAPELEQHTIPIVTGNNLQVGGDIIRRCYQIAMDAGMSKPWEREGPTNDTAWKYDPLLACVKRDRGQMIADLLTIARAWHVAGEPAAQKKVHFSDDFAEWARITSGILAFVGVKGFLENANQIVDVEGSSWEAFIAYWYMNHDSQFHTAKELVTLMEKDSDFADLLPDKLGTFFADERKRPSFHHTLSKAFGKKLNTPFGPDSLCIIAIDRHSNIREYRIIERKRKSTHAQSVSHASDTSDSLADLEKIPQIEKNSSNMESTMVNNILEEINSNVEKNLNPLKNDAQNSQHSHTFKREHISTDLPIGMVQPLKAPEPPEAHVIHRREDPFAGN